MPVQQLNVEYFFRLLYNCFRGSCYGTASLKDAYDFLESLWSWIVVIGYIVSVVGLFFIVYVMVRLFELREKEKERYGTIIPVPDAEEGMNPRWRHIESLADDTNTSKWREAIIEADIMLDDVLAEMGYVGDGVGERLKSIEPSELHSLQDAWEAHKVRNQIAHQGSSFDLSESLSRRTIARYGNVFRDLKVI